MEAKQKSKSKKSKPNTDAVPEHILNMVRNVEKKAKLSKKNHEANKQNCMDSISLIRNMMESVRTNIELTSADDELRAAKEKDIAMIASAKDIFKSMEETNTGDRSPQLQRQTVKLAKDIDWMAEMPSAKRDEELKKRRQREMEMMRAARHMTQEEEERWVADSARRGNEVKRQREMELEMMKMARAQAIEEEAMMEEAMKRSGRREVSPGLEAARGALRRRQEEDMMEDDNRRRGRKAVSPGLEAAKHCLKKDFVDDRAAKIEELKNARQREMEEIKMARARAEMEEREARQEMMRQERDQERARELNELRAGGGQVKQRYNPETENRGNERSQTFAKAPRSKALKSDCWLKQTSQSKEEEMKMEKQRELEEMKMARAQAIEEEEQERAEMEMIKREEAMAKAREMAMLVAELQRMRREEPQDEEGQEKLTGYQEEMLSRVMELAALSRDGVLTVQ